MRTVRVVQFLFVRLISKDVFHHCCSKDDFCSPHSSLLFCFCQLHCIPLESHRSVFFISKFLYAGEPEDPQSVARRLCKRHNWFALEWIHMVLRFTWNLPWSIYALSIASQQESPWTALFLNNDTVNEPDSLYPVNLGGDHGEPLQWPFLVKVFLACSTRLPTHSGKRRGKLDSIEKSAIVQKVAELGAGAGIAHRFLFWLPRHCVGVHHPFWLNSRVEPFVSWKVCETLMPAGDGWRRKTP